MPPDSLEEDLYRATNEIAAASERERDAERARVRHLEIIANAAAQIMGVQACSPQTEEEAIDLAAKLHHVVEQRANCYGTQAADVARIQAEAEHEAQLRAKWAALWNDIYPQAPWASDPWVTVTTFALEAT